ncbi:hypothetical protein TWF718_009593 [Orbilia javanica]|uniref:Uncharacterized protein n=1 Tax=Orbilia javanica TaxID=47235 RepID=A0AAN8REU8_9PEZI
MDAIIALAQLLGRAAPPTESAQTPPLPNIPELAAILQLLRKSNSVGIARLGMPGEQFSLLVRCVVLDGASNQFAAPSAYKVISVMRDVSFEGLVDAVTSRLSFSKLPGRQLRSMQVCDADGVRIVIDNDVAVGYLFGLLGRDSGVKMTVYAVDMVSPSETQRISSPTTAAEFDPSATPIYDMRCRTPRHISPSPSEDATLGGSRGRARQRTPDCHRFPDDKSESPVAQPRELSRDRGYESAPSTHRSSSRRSSHRSSHRSRSPFRPRYSYDGPAGEEEAGEEEEEVSKSPEPVSLKEFFPSHTIPHPHPQHDERPRFCAISVSETGKNQYKHHIVDYLRLRLSTVNKFQQSWNHVMNELFAQKPESEQRPGSLCVEREEGGSTVMMLYMRVKGRPEDRSFYDTSGDVGIIINTKALVPGSFKWTEKPDGTLLISFSTDATFHVVRKNTDPRKDPYSQGPKVNGMNHIAVNIENVPADRLKSPSFRAITTLLDGFNSGKGLDVVIEITASQLPPNPPALMRHCLGAERDDGLVFERDCPFVVEREYSFENRERLKFERDRYFDRERGFERERRFEKERQRNGKRRGRVGDGVNLERNKRVRRA